MYSPILTTERLKLRPPNIEDAKDMFQRYTSDPLATKYLLWKTHTSADETVSFLSRKMQATADSGGGRWVICLKDDSVWGSIAASVNGHLAEVGYMISQQQWGKGLMTEALQVVVNELWHDEVIWRIEASCHTDNLGSLRVLEKCGFKREGLVRRMTLMPQVSEKPQDCYLYAQVRDDIEA